VIRPDDPKSLQTLTELLRTADVSQKIAEVNACRLFQFD
jgi:hypothetical protein